ncbi:MAG: carbamoyl-phosphate synthase small subunit [Alphaproteobacteria bacterium]|nr:MAG: carbamoyl-phosphate synthase small subunit [Alphaproteobacteria bacterium]
MSSPKPSWIPKPNAILLFEDGTEFEGYGIGAEGVTIGELCFNTSMTGYQEILTDPSYHGQIITFTAPHIGNVGCNDEDKESTTYGAAGLVIREAITEPSSWRAQSHMHDWLVQRDVTGISGIDTRALTIHMRQHGYPRVAIAYDAVGTHHIDRDALVAALSQLPSMKGAELTQHVQCAHPYGWTQNRWTLGGGYSESDASLKHVVALDFGAKHNILRMLVHVGCRVTVVPGNMSADSIMELNPDGVFLSNGPGDPMATAAFAVPTIKALLERNIPIFGICLGHQLLALALGARTDKMYQGHRGGNHPVQHIVSGAVEITSQNHGFVVKSDDLPDMIEVTHISLFDGTIEGFRHKTKAAFSVQYHPESSPGPHDSRYLFEQFRRMMNG